MSRGTNDVFSLENWIWGIIFFNKLYSAHKFVCRVIYFEWQLNISNITVQTCGSCIWNINIRQNERWKCVVWDTWSKGIQGPRKQSQTRMMKIFDMKCSFQFLTMFMLFSLLKTKNICKPEEQDIKSQYFQEKVHGELLKFRNI